MQGGLRLIALLLETGVEAQMLQLRFLYGKDINMKILYVHIAWRIAKVTIGGSFCSLVLVLKWNFLKFFCAACICYITHVFLGSLLIAF